MTILPKNELPPGYTQDEEGRWIHSMSKKEILEMVKKDYLIFALAVGNILQAMFTFFLVYSYFCNHWWN